MSSPLDLHSEHYSPTGGIAAAGARRPLGRPKMNPLVLLVREAAQNSWDARASDRKAVRFSIDSWQTSPSQRRALAERCFAIRPRELPLGRILDGDGPVNVIAISDRNTAGLGGPTRSDEDDGDDEPRNFVEFLRNIGRAEAANPGGGTYGYGKASFYLVSGAHTIIAYTRCNRGRKRETRLMAAALGEQYTAVIGGKRRRFTGRHWWGTSGSGGIVDPILGGDADRLAASIGLPGFREEVTGTTILVIQPILGEGRDLARATEIMRDAMLWYCWPKLCAMESGQAEMTFGVSCNGTRVPTLPPDRHPLIADFVGALRIAVGAENAPEPSLGRQQSIEILRPRRHLGMIGLKRTFAPAASAPLPGANGGDDDSEDLGFPAPPFHHVALMRLPRLVVSYRAGERLPVDQLGYAGAFLADPDVNRIFADAEPAAHDEWNHESLDDRNARSCVKVALRRIDEAVRDFISPPGRSPVAAESAPLGAFARQLGALVPDALGPGAEVPVPGNPTGGGGGGGGETSTARRARVEIIGEPLLKAVDGTLMLVVGFTVKLPSDADDARVEAKPRVIVVDNQIESEAPIGAAEPTVLRWRNPSGRYVGTGSDQVTVGRGHEGDWQVEIGIPRNAKIGVAISVVRG